MYFPYHKKATDPNAAPSLIQNAIDFNSETKTASKQLSASFTVGSKVTNPVKEENEPISDEERKLTQEYSRHYGGVTHTDFAKGEHEIRMSQKMFYKLWLSII